MSSTCRSCKEPIRWVTMAGSRKALPLQAAECPPTTYGAVLVVNDTWGYSLNQLAEKVARREGMTPLRAREVVIARYPAHLTHFARCPHAADHRRTG